MSGNVNINVMLCEDFGVKTWQLQNIKTLLSLHLLITPRPPPSPVYFLITEKIFCYVDFVGP